MDLDQALTLIAVALLGALGIGPGHPTSELVGRWRGTSVCTKAEWNAACHDEEALYDFQEGAAPGHVLLKGYKIVDGKPQYMGDLDFTYDDGAKAWVAEFESPRVHSRWSFVVSGDRIDGRAVLLPSTQVARTVHVTRSTADAR